MKNYVSDKRVSKGLHVSPTILYPHLHGNQYNAFLVCNVELPVSYTHLDVYKRQPLDTRLSET